MFTKLLLSLLALFTRPFNVPPVDVVPIDDVPYEAVPYGPSNWTEAYQAMQALYGEHDDMILPEDWPESAGIRDVSHRWPGYPGSATVPYVIDSRLQYIKPLITQAMDQYHRQTCIRFVPRTNQKNYIKLQKTRGCFSAVGCQNKGEQPVSLGDGCGFVGTIVHELGHALGLYHEHQRSDRDQYLKVNMNYVKPGYKHNFDKTDPNKEMIFGSFDHDSIMMYGNYAFSKRPNKLMTMVAKNGTPLKDPFQKPGLNSNDVNMVKKLYQCP